MCLWIARTVKLLVNVCLVVYYHSYLRIFSYGVYIQITVTKSIKFERNYFHMLQFHNTHTSQHNLFNQFPSSKNISNSPLALPDTTRFVRESGDPIPLPLLSPCCRQTVAYREAPALARAARSYRSFLPNVGDTGTGRIACALGQFFSANPSGCMCSTMSKRKYMVPC